MLTPNTRSLRRTYPSTLQSILSVASAEESRRWLAQWDGIRPVATPLYSLGGLARQLGVGRVLLKDESVRSNLGSFKALGAPIALARLIRRFWPDEIRDPPAILKGHYAALLEGFTVISATDGNHGKGLAAAAQSAGCRCVIVLHANVSSEREEAIAAYGAHIVRVAGNYDASVEEAARLAARHGWHVVSDTSYEGYEEIPRDVMQGYSTIAAEVMEALGTEGRLTHVFLQGGVGGLAAGVLSYFWEVLGEDRPAGVIVEPEQADCLYQSALTGSPARATGTVDSVMAGLACGETSPLAWQFLVGAADHFMTIEDTAAVAAMRTLARGNDLDPPIISGESGAAGLAGLLEATRTGTTAEKLGLDATSAVLLINTEGATAPGVYEELVGESADSVLSRQHQHPRAGASPQILYNPL